MSIITGFVCEGSTDYVILRRIVESVVGSIEARPLQPQLDELDRQLPGGRAGWSEVRAWCQRLSSLSEIFDPDIGDPIEILVISVDLDIAIQAGITSQPRRLKPYDTKALKKIIASWLPERIPYNVIIVIPVMTIEAWIVAALFPKLEESPETMENPALFLVENKKIEMGTSGPWKRAQEYRIFADYIVRRLKNVSNKCKQAEIFIKDFEHYSTISRT